MNDTIRNLMDKYLIPKSIQSIYGLEIERIAEDYARQRKEDQFITDDDRAKYTAGVDPIKIIGNNAVPANMFFVRHPDGRLEKGMFEWDEKEQKNKVIFKREIK